MKHGIRVLMVLILPIAMSIHAQEDDLAAPPEMADEPAIPPKVQDEQVEPEVNIRQEEDRRVEEYSLNWRVYMVKITPDKGVPYYYMDEDGDGLLELQPGDHKSGPVRPAFWKVKEW